MASVKDYAFYIEGTKVCIVERDTQFDNDVSSRDYGPGTHRSQWKSPKSSVADGIEIQYTHTPDYFIKDPTDFSTTLDVYYAVDGRLALKDTAGSPDDFTAGPESLGLGSYIVLKKAGQFNGIHKVISLSGLASGMIYTDTVYSGQDMGNAIAFEEQVELYYNVDALFDESDELPIPSYLEKALVYYVKAKLAEDDGEFDKKEYFMREYKKITEKYESSLKAGARIMSTPGPYAIR